MFLARDTSKAHAVIKMIGNRTNYLPAKMSTKWFTDYFKFFFFGGGGHWGDSPSLPVLWTPGWEMRNMGVTGWEHMNSMRNLKDILLFPHSTKNKILFYNISLLPEEIFHPFPSFWPLSPGKGEGIKMGWLHTLIFCNQIVFIEFCSASHTKNYNIVKEPPGVPLLGKVAFHFPWWRDSRWFQNILFLYGLLNNHQWEQFDCRRLRWAGNIFLLLLSVPWHHPLIVWVPHIWEWISVLCAMEKSWKNQQRF